MTDPDPQYLQLRQQLADPDLPDDQHAAVVEQLHTRYLELLRGGQTSDGLPYPDPTDPVTEGADAIRSLAESLHGLILANIATKSADDLPDAYPPGWSLQQLAASDSGNGGWPRAVSAQILTIKGASNVGRTLQWFIQNTTGSAPSIYQRTGNESPGGWSDWVGGAAAYGAAAGRATVKSVGGANNTKTVTVTLPSGVFSQIPSVVATVATTSPGIRSVAVTGTTTSSFVMSAFNGAADASDVAGAWQAVQISSTSVITLEAESGDMAVVVCPTRGCANEGRPVRVSTTWVDDDGTVHPVDDIQCGVCGTTLTPHELPTDTTKEA